MRSACAPPPTLYPRELSGGMARRVALARALALDPPLMIYDEPLTGLDPIASGVIMSLIARLNASLGLTSIIVTHHVHETLPVADRAIVIANGRIVFSGTPAELRGDRRSAGAAVPARRAGWAHRLRQRRAFDAARRRPPDAVRHRHPLARPRRPVLAVGAARVEADARFLRRADARDLQDRRALAADHRRRRRLRRPVGDAAGLPRAATPTAPPTRSVALLGLGAVPRARRRC